MTIRLAFHGGAGTVTGSRFLVTANGRRVLIDCGLFQGLKALRLKNWQPPAFDPRSVDAVVLTHAHIDHSGYLPRLVKEGFRGPIYGTQPTLELATVLLLDAAQLQEEDAAYA
ncbi:MAG TPA: MBL fold metallo-hydrolase, partial [Tepidiformaceae bacterium]